MAGGVQLSHLRRNSDSSPRRNLEAGLHTELRAVAGERGPCRLHAEAHTASLSIAGVKRSLETDPFLCT